MDSPTVQRQPPEANQPEKPEFKRKVEASDLLSDKGFSYFVSSFQQIDVKTLQPEEFTRQLLDLTFQFTHELYPTLSTPHVLNRIQKCPGKDKMIGEIKRAARKFYGGDSEHEMSEQSLREFIESDLGDSGSELSWIQDDQKLKADDLAMSDGKQEAESLDDLEDLADSGVDEVQGNAEASVPAAGNARAHEDEEDDI